MESLLSLEVSHAIYLVGKRIKQDASWLVNLFHLQSNRPGVTKVVSTVRKFVQSYYILQTNQKDERSMELVIFNKE